MFSSSSRLTFLCLVVLLSAGNSGRSADDDPQQKPVGPHVAQATVLGVNADDPERFPLERRTPISLRLKGLEQFLAEGSLEWNPKEALATFELLERLPVNGQRRLIVRPEGDNTADIWVKFSSERIKADSKVDLVFSIRKPENVGAGVFSGDLKIRFRNANLIPEVGFDLLFPVHVVGYGRIIESVRFLEEQPHVGAPASLQINLLTVGSELGQGRFRLLHQSQEGIAQIAARLPLPLRTTEPIVPRYDKRFGQFADVPADSESMPETEVAAQTGDGGAEWAAHTAWRDSSVWERLRSVPVEAAEWKGVDVVKGIVQRHTLDLHLPDTFAMGKWDANLEWDQTPSGSAARPALKHTLSSAIGPGLRVLHRVGWLKDRILMEVVTPKELNPPPEVQVTYPNPAKVGQVTLTRRSAPESGAASKVISYIGAFPPRGSTEWSLDEFGDYSLRVSNAPTGDETLATPTTVRICFQRDVRELAQYPEFPLFASALPFDIWLWSPPHSGKAYYHSRSPAFRLQYSNQQLAEGRIRILPVYLVPECQRNAQRKLILDADRDDEVVIETTAETGTVSDGMIVLPKDDWLPFTIKASTDKQDPPTSQRRQLGPRCYEQKLLFVASDASGALFTRVWTLPVRVRVDHEWEHNKWVFLSGGVIGGVVIAGAAAWWIARRRRRSRGWNTDGEPSPARVTGDFLSMSAPEPPPSHRDSGKANTGDAAWWGKKSPPTPPPPSTPAASEEPPTPPPPPPPPGGKNWYDS